ncbi:AAA family ATPase [Desulfallas thermosapovorans]|uniref:Pilus assembly protein CpaE n=1 Tax=Desulfallas thermosapovorans DSM 6562 TaxID=1121431 RepID=A0A5S4ZTX3_9FIRM|nr:AAA family ATPase [Desulfallas thermosapovorans]TYO96150.1 pilus assembly protein CpaE [Desulfallas thermosapovorans DSM 6562]
MKAVAVYGCTASTGKTSVAKELAGFFHLQGRSTMLVDLDLTKGQLTEKLGLNSSPNIGTWLTDIFKKLDSLPFWNINYTRDEIEPYVQKFDGLSVLASNTADNLDSSPLLLYGIDVIMRSLLATPYDVLVFDTNGKVRDYTFNALLRMNKVLLVAEPFGFSLPNAEAFIRLLQDEGFNPDQFGLVLNRYPTYAEEDPLEISRALGISLYGVLPNYPDLSGKKGHARIFTMDRSNRFTEEIGNIAQKIWSED